MAALLYGLPSNIADLAPKLDAEEIRLAGCTVSEAAPQWHCCACHHEWGVTEWAPFLRDSRLKREAADAAQDAEARARGPLSAVVRPDGWVRCPHCGWRFTTHNKYSWDGQRHKVCGAYLTLTSDDPNA